MPKHSHSNYKRWTSIDALKWKYQEIFKGDSSLVYNYKLAWIAHNKNLINQIARQFQIPNYLLAGIAWAEVGGDPHIADHIIFPIRAFDWSGPKWVDNNLTISHNPTRTSFGTVSMQLRVAAKYFGLNPENLTHQQQLGIIEFLENDKNNLYLVARHILDLIIVDFPSVKIHQLTDEHVRIIATRYNRGFHLTLSQIKANTHYGDKVLAAKHHIIKILNGN